MAIQLRYQVPAQGLATAYEEVGIAQDAQRQADIARQQSNLDRQFEQQSLQGDQDRQLRYDLAGLQAQQQNRQLGAGLYQFDAQRQDRAAMAEMDIASRFQQELMRQQGFEDMRDSQAELQTQEIAADLTKEQMRIKQHYQDREFNQAMAAAKAIEEQRQSMSPEMYEQARGQWDSRYGQTAGEYPFMGPGRPQNAPEMMASIRDTLKAGMGDLWYEGAEKDFMDLEGPDRLKYSLDMRKIVADQAQAKEQAEMDRWVKEQDFQIKAEQDAEKHQFDMVKNAEKLAQEKRTAEMKMAATRETEILKQEMELRRPFDYDKETGAPKFLEEKTIQEILGRMRGSQQSGASTPQKQPATKKPSSQLPTYNDTQVQSSQIGERFMWDGGEYERTGLGPRDFKRIR